MYHSMVEYLLILEVYILKMRSEISSKIVGAIFFVSRNALKILITFLSEECVVKT